MAYSHVPGYSSLRNTTKGSWFIQSLAQVMETESDKSSFTDLLTKVCYKVSFDYESMVPDDKTFDKQKQVPSFTSMLTRKLVFKPKIQAS